MIELIASDITRMALILLRSFHRFGRLVSPLIRLGLLGRVLVVLQFAVCIGLSIVAFVVIAQINYARHVETGFRRDGIVTKTWRRNWMRMSS